MSDPKEPGAVNWRQVRGDAAGAAIVAGLVCLLPGWWWAGLPLCLAGFVVLAKWGP